MDTIIPSTCTSRRPAAVRPALNRPGLRRHLRLQEHLAPLGWEERRVPVTLAVGGRDVGRFTVKLKVPLGLPEKRVKELALEQALGRVVVRA